MALPIIGFLVVALGIACFKWWASSSSVTSLLQAISDIYGRDGLEKVSAWIDTYSATPSSERER